MTPYELGYALAKRAQATTSPSQFHQPRIMPPQMQLIQPAMPGNTLFGQSAPATFPAGQPSEMAQPQQPTAAPEGLIRQAEASIGGESSSGGSYAGERPQGSPLPTARFGAESFQRGGPIPVSKMKGRSTAPVQSMIGKLKKALYLDRIGR